MFSLEMVMSVFLFDRSFEFDPESSCHGCTKDTRVNIINIGLQVDMTHRYQILMMCPIQNRVLGLFATIVIICCGESFTLTVALLTSDSEKRDISFTGLF